MCHCKTCTDRLHVIIVIIAIAIPYLLDSCLLRFPFLHTCIAFTSRRFFYALPKVHDTSSKNAQVSPATTSFPWRYSNTWKNHGYNAVADDSGKMSSATTPFPWRHTNTCKNHRYNAVADDSGQVSSTTSFPWRHTNLHKNNWYNAVAEVSCAGSHFMPGIMHLLPTKKVKNVEKVKRFRTIHTLRSLPDERGDVCKVWFRLVQKCEFV
jgi:hypothetical protein